MGWGWGGGMGTRGREEVTYKRTSICARWDLDFRRIFCKGKWEMSWGVKFKTLSMSPPAPSVFVKIKIWVLLGYCFASGRFYVQNWTVLLPVNGII